MSTSDRGAADDLARFMDPSGASAASAAGMPDPAILARMATDFFGAMNSLGVGTAMPSGTGSTAAIPSIQSAPITAAGLPGISPSVSALPAAAAIPGPAIASSTGLPGASEAALVPGFSFLQDVRSFDAPSRAAGSQGIATAATPSAPSESQLRTLAAATPAVLGVQAIPAALSVSSVSGIPAIPGTPGFNEVQNLTNPADASRLAGAPAAGQSGAIAPFGFAANDALSPSFVPLPGTAAIPASPGAVPVAGAGSIDPSLVSGLGFMQDVRSLDALARSATDLAGSTGGTRFTAPAQASFAPSVAPDTTTQSPTSTPPAAPASTPTTSAIPTSASAVPGISGMSGTSGMPGMPSDPNIQSLGAAGDAASQSASTSSMLPFGISLDNLQSPQSLGALTPSTSLMRDPTFGFFDVIRPLDPSGVAPAGGSTGNPNLGNLHAADVSSVPFDVQSVRRDFPILQERINGRQLVWLDNAATTQKPQSVIDRLAYFYQHENSNVHRAAHTLAARSTDAYEAAREKVRRFINAGSTKEVVFVRGTTEGINLVAQSWGRRNVQKDDEIVVTHLEHHANIVPWQMLCAEKGAKLRVAPVDDSGQIILEEYEKLLNPRTRLVSFSQVSNALGTITPVVQMVEMAHRHGARVLVDGAQSVAHTRVDMQAYDCDFFVFSGHKIFAPTGIGVVFGKLDILENTPPWQGGGNMIADVTFEKTVYNPPPVRFEAGTGNIADAIGLGAALDYIDRLGMHNISRYEHDLLEYGTHVLQRIPGLRLIGTAKEKAGVLSFVLDGYRTEDVGAALAREGIAVRSGHHCAQPILRRFGVESTVRPSLAFYNTCEELDQLAAAIWNLKGGRTPSVI